MPCWEYDMNKECSPVRHFNLATRPWIQGMMSDGSTEQLSLYGVYERGEDIVTLHGMMPERVSILSLLAIISQESAGSIPDKKAWKDCRKGMAEAAHDYIQQNEDRFDLYVSFLQAREMANMKARNHVRELSLERPFGSRSAFFDQRYFCSNPSDAEVARMLLIYQSFDAGGTMNKPDPWTGKKISAKLTAPLCGKLMMVVEGTNLLDTIHLHVFPKDRLDKLNVGTPPWMGKLNTRSDFEDYARSYYGSLMPMSRVVYLFGDGEMAVSESLAVPKGEPRPWTVGRHPMLVTVPESTK